MLPSAVSVEKGVSYLIAFGNSNYVDFYDYHKCKNMHVGRERNIDEECFVGERASEEHS